MFVSKCFEPRSVTTTVAS